ncbi:MAG TPA: aldehyde ferredoxin oxidoreductase family protein [Clostridia bacterium]|nr:aldehyde ferredoxin oxidoreductase family protein [Clostridia bacterium]
MYGYTGKLLYVDLSSKQYEEKEISMSLIKKYIGGRGLGSALLRDCVKPGTDALGPDNVMMFLTGPITGTLAPGGAKYVVVTKSPVSGGYCDSYSSGRLSIELKASGYDGVVIRGQAADPSVLVIQDNRIEILDAYDLWGQDTFYTEKELKQKYGEEAGVACIGPAGEKLVKYASINSDYYRQAARGGVGTVMGSKKLKAIVVKGSNGVKCFDGEGLLQKVKEYKTKLDNSPFPKKRMKYGTPLSLNVTNSLGMLPTRNFRDGHFDEAIGEIDGDGFIKDVVKHKGCIGCLFACSKVTKIKDGEFSGDVLEGPEYETLALFGSNLGITNRSAVIRANIKCDMLGLDTISAGNVIGFAMECYERGLISKEQCSGLELKFGNYREMLELINMICERAGIGDILAEGVRYSADKIGHNSQSFAHHIKGLEFPGYDPRGGYGIGLAFSVTPRGACHRRAWPPQIESLGEIKPDTVYGKAAIVKDLFNETNIYHSVLACDFPYKMTPLPLNEVSSYMQLVTGMEFSEAELNTLAERVETSIRIFNTQEGLTRKDDTLPERSLKEPINSGPSKGLYIPEEALDFMLDEYYALRGWDQNGVPLKETIEKLDI